MRNPGRGSIVVAAGAAFVGLAAGLAASAGRKAALQAAEAAISGDWIDVLKAEHLDVAEVLDEIDHVGADHPGKRKRLAGRLRALLDKHAFQEDSVLYPAVKLSGALEAAAALVDEHAEIRALLYLLDKADPASAQWFETLGGLRVALEAHVRREEDEVFPALAASLSAKESAELTQLMLKAGSKFA
jgi:iron-sulfur cluster repair protein YtfE (RIC family)